MQRDEHPLQEEFVLLFEGNGEAVDDAAQDLEQLGDAVELLELVDEAEEDVVDLLADEGAQAQELAVDAVQDGLEEVALAGILTVEQIQDI